MPTIRMGRWPALAAALTLCGYLSAPLRAQTLGRTDPNAGLFPDSSLVDFHFLLDAPAGKHGFLQVGSGGRFAWPDGTRARFWGVNISNRSIFQAKPDQIDRVVAVLARAGCNMVRFEATDSIGALLDSDDPKSSRKLDEAKLATLDNWTAKLKARGIYYYFDLLDFRQFKEADGVEAYDQLGRAAKPYAFFDRRLIDLQKEYAAALLTHKNSTTGLKYVDDPALALVEICNEHGLFMKAASLDALAPPYGAELSKQFGDWLLKQYGTRDKLKQEWGQLGDVSVLGPSEDPAAGTVSLPNFTPASAPVNPPEPFRPDLQVIDVRRAPARLRDGVRFLYDRQRAYFREMKACLRQAGLKVPITGVVSNDIVPDVASAAAELDFTSENYYADHPAFAGKEWEGTFFYSDANPLRGSSTYQIAPWLAALRWDNKPVVVREWATVWPNRYRAVAMPEMAAYASMQDFGAVLLFGYQIAREPDALSDFDHQADPTVWGLFGMAALTFLRGDINPSPYSATLAWTPETLYRWPNDLNGLHRLAWFVRLNSTLGGADAPKAARAPQRTRLASRGSSRGEPLRRRPPRDITLPAADAGALPAALDQLALAGAPISSKMLESGVFVGAPGEVVRRTQDGLLSIQTARTVAICGDLPIGRPLQVGDFTLVSPTAIGAFVAVSLDGLPLAKSRRFIAKMVSRAENTGQELEPAATGAPGRYHLKAWGKAPVLTFGQAGKGVLKLRRGPDTLMTLSLTDGTWELLVQDGHATLVCDTPGARGSLYGKPILTTASAPIVVSSQTARR